MYGGLGRMEGMEGTGYVEKLKGCEVRKQKDFKSEYDRCRQDTARLDRFSMV